MSTTVPPTGAHQAPMSASSPGHPFIARPPGPSPETDGDGQDVLVAPVPRRSKRRTYHELSRVPLTLQLDLSPTSGHNPSGAAVTFAVHATQPTASMPSSPPRPLPASPETHHDVTPVDAREPQPLPPQPGRQILEPEQPSTAPLTDVQLEARIWRECRFFDLHNKPASGTDPPLAHQKGTMSGVYACVRLRPSSVTKLYEIVHVWLVNNQTCEVYSSRVAHRPRTAIGLAPGSGANTTIVMTARPGPTWDLCTSCDVVVQLRRRRPWDEGNPGSSQSDSHSSSSSTAAIAATAAQDSSSRAACSTALGRSRLTSVDRVNSSASRLNSSASGGSSSSSSTGHLPRHLLLRATDEAVAVEVVFRRVDVLFILLRVLLSWLYTLLVLPLETFAARAGNWPTVRWRLLRGGARS